MSSTAAKKYSTPILLIGAGGIVNDAHLPAYKKAGFTVSGIFDIDRKKAEATAHRFSIPHVYNNIDEMVAAVANEKVVFDVAVPGNVVLKVLEQLPDGAAVLIQKPMGETFAQALAIRELCRRKHLLAAINFQLRFAPFVTEVRRRISEGKLGTLADIEININVYTPWDMWSFLSEAPRVEILYHSIHYIDLVRSFLGNPRSVYARTVRHPSQPALAAVRSDIIMDYGDWVRASIHTNHQHVYGAEEQQSYIKWEGTGGAAKVELGVLKNYPHGEPDKLRVTDGRDGQHDQWTDIATGSWFPDAFAGSMTELLKVVAGEKERPDHSVEDCIHTMACVEAAYQSSDAGGIPPRVE
ncbi:Gfo/Idh/MocA family oxidoreductase [Nostoc ellipsosporum NOK]|nr:Gfo/Idh/MocA family oxidoreductase [Nostoc ellipsosporum NOK]